MLLRVLYQAYIVLYIASERYITLNFFSHQDFSEQQEPTLSFSKSASLELPVVSGARSESLEDEGVDASQNMLQHDATVPRGASRGSNKEVGESDQLLVLCST